MVRTPSCDKSGLRKGTWTPDEDRKLTAYVTRYGCWNWRQLPKYAGLSRCGKSCRLRWMNYLRPNIKRGNYTREEEEIIIRLHESLGNRWSAIAAQLPGRTDNEIKNYWHTYIKKRKSNDTTKQDFIGLSQPKKTRKDKIQPNIIDPLNPATTQIVESSTLCPTPSTSDFSSSTADNAAVTSSCSDLKSDDEFAFLEAYEAPCGDFWTEPFLADNYYMPFEFLAPQLDPLSDPLFDGELLYSYDVCDFGILNWQL